MAQQAHAPQFILGSTSRYRADALKQLGLRFTQHDPGVDEDAYRNLPPVEQARTLATVKAGAVIAQAPQAWVIAADQTGVCDGVALHKPGNAQNAVDQLLHMQGREVRFYSAVTVAVADQIHTDVVATRLKMRSLSRTSLEHYVAVDQPFDCAGGFKAEALGIALFESIQSDDPSALIGLPLIALTRLLNRVGFEVLS